MFNFKDYLQKHKDVQIIGIIIITVIIITVLVNFAKAREEERVAQLNDAKYQEGIEFIKQGNWEEATIALVMLQEKDYSYSKVLYNYASAKEFAEGNDFVNISMADHYMQSVLDDYNGPFKDDILSFKAECAQRDKVAEEEREKQRKAIEEANKITPGCHKIRIGMSTYEAEISMGKPYDINRTVGSYGVREQWCYKGGVYLYFDNNILTSWQD